MLKHNIHACTRSRNEKGGGESEPFFFSFYINIHTAFITFLKFFRFRIGTCHLGTLGPQRRRCSWWRTVLPLARRSLPSTPKWRRRQKRKACSLSFRKVLRWVSHQRVAYRVLMLIHSFPCHAASLVTETHATSVAAHAATHVVLIISY